MANMVSMIKRNAAVNADGFGLGWYNLEVDFEPCIFTSIAPAEHNVNLARLSKKIQSHLIFGHVRAATLGSPVNDTNCHPFQFGRYLWMHNGCIANWCAVKRPLTALLSSCSFGYISGTTDSEVAGALFVDQLPNHNPNVEHSSQDIIDAMKRTIQIITQLVHCLHIPGSGVSIVSSLNFAVSDGKTVVATRFRDSPIEEPPSLYYCKVTHMEMVANEMEIHHDPKMPSKGVVIASEPLTYQSENWTLIPKNHMLVVTNSTEVQLLPIPISSEMITSRWISEAESSRHSSLHLSISDLNCFFGTACCGCPAESSEISPPVANSGGTMLNSSQSSLSAPSSPPIGRHFSPNTKSAMILESPVMTGALRALLASATPSQLREILESNLLPCPSTSSSGSIKPMGTFGQTPVAAGNAAVLDYAAVAQSLTASQRLQNSPDSSCSSLPPFTSSDFPFMNRGDSPVVLQSDKHHQSSLQHSSPASYLAPYPQNGQSNNGHHTPTKSEESRDVFFTSPGTPQDSDLPIIPTTMPE
jgi:glutamine amidotransferase